jgi:hypothetical protein
MVSLRNRFVVLALLLALVWCVPVFAQDVTDTAEPVAVVVEATQSPVATGVPLPDVPQIVVEDGGYLSIPDAADESLNLWPYAYSAIMIALIVVVLVVGRTGFIQIGASVPLAAFEIAIAAKNAGIDQARAVAGSTPQPYDDMLVADVDAALDALEAKMRQLRALRAKSVIKAEGYDGLASG